MRLSTLAVVSLAALSLAACGKEDRRAGTCKPPPAAKANAAPDGYAKTRQVADGQPGYEAQDAKATSEDAKACVQRQAWALSKSRDTTEIVADAAVTACDALIARSAQAEAASYGGDFQKPYDLDVRAMTRWARLYVVQYRSGQCVD